MAKVHLKWLYIGTERGNVHLVNYENFLLNDYVINWNKGKSIIEGLLRVLRPGLTEARPELTETRPGLIEARPGYSTEPWFNE